MKTERLGRLAGLLMPALPLQRGMSNTMCLIEQEVCHKCRELAVL